MISSLKEILKKNKTIYKTLQKIINYYYSYKLVSKMDSKEKRLRRKYRIGISPIESLVDTKFFWLIYNMIKLLIFKSENQSSDKLSGESWLVIDAGASNGFYSLLLEKFIPNAEFHLFEPQLKYRDDLKKLKKNFFVYNFLVGEHNGVQKYFENNIAEGLTSISKININYKYLDKEINYQIYNEHESQIIRIDEVIKTKKNILLKCDTQGSELKILKGAQRLFDLGLIKIIHLELMTIKKYDEQDNYIEIFNFLDSLDFILFDTLNTCKETDLIYGEDFFGRVGQLTEFEVVFIHKSISKISF